MKEKIQRIGLIKFQVGDEDEDIAQNILDAYRAVNRLLDPEGFGFVFQQRLGMLLELFWVSNQ